MTTQPSRIINDVTHLNPIPVWAVATPTTTEEVQDALRRFDGAVSVGGGHFSMGGQTASPGSLHLDMRAMNKVLEFAPVRKTIRVQSGVRWCDIQRFVDPHGLAVKIMQTYANFTVGGSLSVNVHGRYMGLGPLIMSVRSIRLVLADGSVVDASAQQHSEIFYGAIGGYGGLGVIVEAELELADNVRVERQQLKMKTTQYAAWFREKIRPNREAVFHNADLYGPHYTTCRAVTWVETKKAVTTPQRLQQHRRLFPLEKYFLWTMSEMPAGRWRREHLIDPLLYLSSKVHWRNYEAGYDVAELEPPSRIHRTYVLQEYFIPVERFDEFVPKMAAILQRHRVNMLNISVRHAAPDPGALMAWAKSETFAFVLYYKQRTRDNARERVAVWTRELIDAALSCGGTYYLPYQPHATPEQFHRAYPRARELFALKEKLDPACRFRNVLWDTYYLPFVPKAPVSAGEFHSVYRDTGWHDAFYRFLQNIYSIYPEDRFHTLIKQACASCSSDEEAYRHIQTKLGTIKPVLADLTRALPALFKQKAEMLRQTLELLGERRAFDGYVEIGSTGRYASVLRKQLKLTGQLVMINEFAPTNSPVDIVERGQLGKLGRFVPLNDYAPISDADIADASVDLVSCYIGLHHIEPSRFDAFMRSVSRILRPGGVFILRDHDVTSSEMFTFVALVHTVFNAGLNEPWERNAAELRHFAPIADWVSRLAAHGFQDSGKRMLQAHDPTDNVLMAFTKVAA
jgi:FAD/FMN-containing dehydrogenase